MQTYRLLYNLSQLLYNFSIARNLIYNSYLIIDQYILIYISIIYIPIYIKFLLIRKRHSQSPEPQRSQTPSAPS